MEVMVIEVSHNQLRVQWGPTDTKVVTDSFSHPRSLLGNWNVLLSHLKNALKSWQSTRSWWQMPPLLHVVWVLPPQEGGLLEWEKRLIKELTHSMHSGRVYAYAIESAPLNYAQWPEKIPHLTRL